MALAIKSTSTTNPDAQIDGAFLGSEFNMSILMDGRLFELQGDREFALKKYEEAYSKQLSLIESLRHRGDRLDLLVKLHSHALKIAFEIYSLNQNPLFLERVKEHSEVIEEMVVLQPELSSILDETKLLVSDEQ